MTGGGGGGGSPARPNLDEGLIDLPLGASLRYPMPWPTGGRWGGGWGGERRIPFSFSLCHYSRFPSVVLLILFSLILIPTIKLILIPRINRFQLGVAIIFM